MQLITLVTSPFIIDRLSDSPLLIERDEIGFNPVP